MNEFKPQLAHWNLAPYGAAASYDEGSEVKAEDEEKYDKASGMTLVRHSLFCYASTLTNTAG